MHRNAGLFFCTLSMLAITTLPVVAQTQAQIERRYTPDYRSCINASEGVTASIMDCTGAEIERHDARLNQAYVMVMRPLTPAKKNTLRTLQRAWIKQRDARCQARIRGNNGTEASLIYSGCILDETIKRTIFLEYYKA